MLIVATICITFSALRSLIACDFAWSSRWNSSVLVVCSSAQSTFHVFGSNIRKDVVGRTGLLTMSGEGLFAFG